MSLRIFIEIQRRIKDRIARGFADNRAYISLTTTGGARVRGILRDVNRHDGYAEIAWIEDDAVSIFIDLDEVATVELRWGA